MNLAVKKPYAVLCLHAGLKGQTGSNYSHESKIGPAVEDGRTLNEQTDTQMLESYIPNSESI